MGTKKVALFTLLSVMAISFSGCSNKNILMPGKSESECSRAGGTYGMCGSPKNIYKYRSDVQDIDMHGDDSYHVDKNGEIRSIKNGELGDVVNGDGSKVSSTGSGVKVGSSSGNVIIKDRNYMLSNVPKSSIIRNQEVVRKAWVDTCEDQAKNLIVEHDILVVVKKPSWAVGERRPENVKSVKFIPSFIATEAIEESHRTGRAKDDVAVQGYLNEVEETPEEDLEIGKYIEEEK